MNLLATAALALAMSTDAFAVAVGKGAGQRTDITFAPTRAKFVRITQTDAVADAPAWTIQGLRVFEVPAPPAK